jgi:hypothetical protein
MINLLCYLLLVAVDEKIGLPFEFLFVAVLTFNNDDDEEYFCRLFICFKS